MTYTEPPPSCEPTCDQLTAIGALLEDGGLPYTDFALLGPFGARVQRQEAFKGVLWGPNGFQIRELKGPSTIEAWSTVVRFSAQP